MEDPKLGSLLVVAGYIEPHQSPSETRAHAQLAHILASFKRGGSSRGKAFADGLEGWLRIHASDHTRRAYSFAVFEFFDWYEVSYGSLPMPDRVERNVAISYVDYLKTRGEGLDEQRLARDPRFRLELAAYRAIKRRPGLDEPGLRLALESEQPREVSKLDKDTPGWFTKFAACLVTRRLADRSPTYQEIRTVWRGRTPPPYTYRLHVHSRARGVERTSTIVSRTEALASLWSYWIERSGENSGHQRALLEHNIWSPVADAHQKSATAQRRARRELTAMSFETFKTLVASTYAGNPMSLKNVRDRALLLFMFYTGVRSDELVTLRRSSLTGEPPIVTVVGKGDKMRQFRLPSQMVSHLGALSEAIDKLVRDEEHVPSARRLELARMLSDSAPLFPPLTRHGCAATPREAMSRDGLAMMMRRRAIASGLGAPELLRTVHPHAIRALAAQVAVDMGTPLSRVQAVLGHEHVTTTAEYAKEYDPRALVLFREPETRPPVQVAPAPPRGVSGPIIEAELVEPPPRAPGALPAGPAIGIAHEPVQVREPVMPGQRLIEVGATRYTHEQALEGQDLHRDALVELGELYRPDTWGERKKARSQIHSEKIKLAGYDADEDRLTHTYIGDMSHLIWWDGFSGKLSPSMPVLSVRQAFEHDARFGRPVQEDLGELWARWYESEDPRLGPTAAAALVQWVREALVTMDQVELARESLGLPWVAFDSPILESPSFREHREDMIEGWFAARASSWTMTAGRPGKGGVAERPGHTHDSPKIPDFYEQPDPLLVIQPDQRADFFDWLAAMTGKAPSSTDKRFLAYPGASSPTLSRRQLAGLVALFCAFESAEEQLGDDPAELRRALKVADDAIAKTVEKLSDGRTKGFLYSKRALARKKETRAKLAGETGHERESRRKFQMRLLGELFGEDAGKDPVLALYATCGGEPLAGRSVPGGSYADFFRVQGSTIVHTSDFARAFAKETGTHSECVARRIARSLYELWKTDARLVTRGREGELEMQLASWMAFKVSCPAGMEKELRARIGAPDSSALDQAFRRAKDASEIRADTELESELEARVGRGGESVFETRGLAEGGGFHFAKNASSRIRKRVPDPVVMLFWVHQHRRTVRALELDARVRRR